MFKIPTVTVASRAPIHPPTCSSTSKASLLLLSIRRPLLSLLRLVKWVRGRGGARASPTGAPASLPGMEGSTLRSYISRRVPSQSSTISVVPYTMAYQVCSAVFSALWIILCSDLFLSADFFTNTTLNLQLSCFSIVLP